MSIVCFAEGETLSFVTVSSKPQTFPRLRNSLHKPQPGERWIKEDIQANLTPNESTE